MIAYIGDLHWQSDWNGEDVGFPEVPVVGLYTSASLGVDLYINAEDSSVLEIISAQEAK